jgi:tetratricopeptide (TPR) repeat protein
MKQWIAAVTLFAVAAVAGAQEPAPPAGAADFVQGQRALRKRDVDTAIAAFEGALRANPDLFLSHYYLGYAYQSKQDWENTGTQFSLFLMRVDEDDPIAARIVFHATRQGGLALARTETPTRAVPYLEKIVDADPKDVDVHFYLGVALLAAQRRGEAKKLFARVIELDSDYAEAYYYAGRIAFDEQDAETAGQRLARFVRLQPRSPHGAHAHLLLGQLAARAGDAEKAAVHLEGCLALEPSGPYAEEAQRSLERLTVPEATGGQDSKGR